MIEQHVDAIVFNINGIGEICALTARSLRRTAERISKGENVTPQSLIKSDEFFDIRLKANRAVIDNNKFYPTTMEMNTALFRHANHVLELARLGS